LKLKLDPLILPSPRGFVLQSGHLARQSQSRFFRRDIGLILVREWFNPTKMQPVHNVIKLVFARRDEGERDDLAFRE
jgi:hypothetical protein